MPLNAEINVVSLIDVMMLLLVIFMITAPMMQGGVDVALPKARGAAARAQERSRRDGRSRRVRSTSTRRACRSPSSARRSARWPASARREGVYLRGDAGVPYGVVTQVLAIMRAAGVGDVGLVTDPESAK